VNPLKYATPAPSVGLVSFGSVGLLGVDAVEVSSVASDVATDDPTLEELESPVRKRR
jgi:hypothetical protein